jgi:hypothetical protein
MLFGDVFREALSHGANIIQVVLTIYNLEYPLPLTLLE